MLTLKVYEIVLQSWWTGLKKQLTLNLTILLILCCRISSSPHLLWSSVWYYAQSYHFLCSVLGKRPFYLNFSLYSSLLLWYCPLDFLCHRNSCFKSSVLYRHKESSSGLIYSILPHNHYHSLISLQNTALSVSISLKNWSSSFATGQTAFLSTTQSNLWFCYGFPLEFLWTIPIAFEAMSIDAHETCFYCFFLWFK